MEKAKRERGIIAAWVWTLIILCWIAGGIFLATINFGIGGLVIWILITAFLGLISSSYIWNEQYVKTLEYSIYEYDKWSRSEQEYVKRYVYESKTLTTIFVYNHQLKEVENSKSLEEVEENILSCIDKGWGRIEYKTKDDVMRSVVEEIKYLITKDKTEENILIKNISSLETFTVDELAKKLEKGEFKHLDKKKEDDK